MRGVPGIVEGIKSTTIAKVDRPGIAERYQPFGWHGAKVPEEPIHVDTEDPMGAGEESARIGKVARTSLMDDDLRLREGCGDITDAAGMVQVDVRDDDCRQVIGADAELVEPSDDHAGRTGCARLNQTRTTAADDVARGDALVSPHPRIEMEDLVPQCLNWACCV